jgi:hypothetical protein
MSEGERDHLNVCRVGEDREKGLRVGLLGDSKAKAHNMVADWYGAKID